MALNFYVETDTKFLIRSVNEQILKTLGLSTARVRRSSIFDSIFRDVEVRKLVLAKFNQAIDRREDSFTFQTAHRVGTDVRIQVKWMVEIARSAAGAVVKFSGVAGITKLSSDLAAGNAGIPSAKALSEFSTNEALYQLAHATQTAIIPKRIPHFKGLSVAGSYIPMRAIGGGFYFFLPSRESELALVMGEINASGMAAVMLKSIIRVALDGMRQFISVPSRGLLELHARPRTLFPADVKMRALWLYLNVRKGTCRYASAGMPGQLFFKHGAASPFELNPTGPTIGDGNGSWTEESMTLETGDRLVLHTPGFYQLAGTDGAVMDDALFKKWVEDESHERVHAAKQNLLTRCRRFIHPSGLKEDLGLVMVDAL